MRRDIAEVVARDEPWDELSGARVLVAGAGGMIPAYSLSTPMALNDALRPRIEVVGLVGNRGPGHAQPVGRARAVGLHARRARRHGTAGARRSAGCRHPRRERRSTRSALHRPVGTIRANLYGTFNLLNACVGKGAGRLVLMSSAEVQGAQPEGVELIGEDDYGRLDPLNPPPRTPRGNGPPRPSALPTTRSTAIHVTIARFGHICGPGMSLDDGRVQAEFARNTVGDEDILLHSGSAMRTYAYVADAVAGMFTAMLRGERTAYNIADASGMVTIHDLAGMFTRTLPAKGLTVRFGPRVDPSAFSPSARKGLSSARLEALGWSPVVALPDGLDRFVSHRAQLLGT